MPNYVMNRLTMSGSSPRMWAQAADFVNNEEEGLTFDFNKIIPMPYELDILDGDRYVKLERLYLHYCTPFSKYSPLLGASEMEFESVRMTEKIWNQLGCPEAFDPEKYLLNEDRLLLSGRYPLYNSSDSEFNPLYIGFRMSQNQIFYGYSTWYGWRMMHWGTKWNAIHASLLSEGFGWRFETAWRPPEKIIRALSVIFPSQLFTLRYADEDLGHNCGEATYCDGHETHIYLPEEETDIAVAFAERLWNEDERRGDK